MELLNRNVEILQNMHMKQFGPSEWVNYVPDYSDDEIISKKKITRDSTPHKIFYTILAYEEKSRNFYTSISENVIGERQRELFESLITFQEEQISKINNYIKTNA